MRNHDVDPAALHRLSPAALEVLRLHAERAYTQLVPRQPRSEVARAALAKLSPRDVLANDAPDQPDRDERAAATLAGLWLWHDFLDESHRLAQDIHTTTGSFWHAIMHRREGDFSNSKYWYARCAGHPAMTTIADEVTAAFRGSPVALEEGPLAKVLRGGGWDPRAFVDLVDVVHDRPDDPAHPTAVQLQRLEWVALFEHTIGRVRS